MQSTIREAPPTKQRLLDFQDAEAGILYVTADNLDGFNQDAPCVGDPSTCSSTVLCKSLEPDVTSLYVLLGKWEISAVKSEYLLWPPSFFSTA